MGARKAALLLALLAAGGAAAAQDPMAHQSPDPSTFRAWAEAFAARAEDQGVPADVARPALAAAEFRPEIVDRDRNQTEFTKPLWEYIPLAASDARIEAGRAALADHAPLFERIEAETGVDREIVAAIWGLESSFGANRGDVPAIPALATLAFDGRRGAFFEAQLLAALRILAGGHVAPEAMVGSWAGAMGHTQFMPTTWVAHAVDWDGDGRRDIWGDDPADALASTAAFLAAAGWVPDQPWGVEVVLPDGFDVTLARDTNRQDPSYWAALGVRDAEGGVVPDHGSAVILLPAGHRGPAFMTFRNFTVLEKYNTADAYVIGVGHLADRLRGGPPIRARWPQDPMLTFAERVELQERLTAAGFDTLGIDGLMGPRTINAVRNWQRAQGEVPDGYATPTLLERLR